MKDRRDILRRAGAVSVAAGAGTLLQACASTPAAPKPPPKPVALLGLLPVGPEVVMPGDTPRAKPVVLLGETTKWQTSRATLLSIDIWPSIDMTEAATIYEVADTAQVSVRTVSRYLNDPGCVSQKTSARIVAAMEALHFRPSKAARSLKGVAPNLIGVVSDRITTSPDSFELIKGLQLAAKEWGKRLLIAESGGIDEDVPELIDELIEHRVDALIYATHFHRPVDLRVLERASGTRLVLLNCYAPKGEYAAVVPNDEQGARDGLAHLYALGHRRVVVFELFPDMRATQLRRRGCLAAAKTGGFKPPAFVQGSDRASVEDEFAAIDGLVSEVLGAHRPTAIMAGNDKMAARIIQCLHRRGVAVPAQVSVLGFDDHPMLVHATDPPLTSVQLPYLQMGRRAAELASGECGGVGIVREACVVQTRASVGPPPGRR